jgi:tetratricopeptide (TPR) repeat protein
MSGSHTKQVASSRFALFAVLVLTLAFGAGSLFIYEMKNRLEQVETKLGEPYRAGAVEKDQPSNESSDRILDGIKVRLGFLEGQQGNIAASARSALEEMYFISAVIAAFFGLFAAFSAYRQLLSDSSQENRDREMLGLVGEFRQNITVINGLIGTLQQTYQYKSEVENRIKLLDTQIVQIDRFKQKTEDTLRERINGINADSFALYRTLDRQSFKKEESKGKLQSFYVNMSTVERMTEVSGLFNPFTYICRGLYFFNQMQYDPAVKDLVEALRLGRHESDRQSMMTWYSEATETQVKDQLLRLQGDCNYHIGIIHYNIGEFEKARKAFGEACSVDKYDFRSRIYIPELMFFDSTVPFSRVRLEFEAANKELEDLTQEQRGGLKMTFAEANANIKLREGNIYLPKMIPLNWRAGYRSEENAAKAIPCYREAFDCSEKDETRQSLTDIFSMWSLAQGLEPVGPSLWGQQHPMRLYSEVFRLVSKHIVFKTEPVVLTQLNYILAVCADKAYRNVENPRAYLSRAREQLQKVPDHICVFSPINKIVMTRQQLLAEMELFESTLGQRGTDGNS